MCLINVTNKRAKIAKEDIPCYKVLERKIRCNGFYTPCMHSIVVLGRTYTSKLDQPSIIDDVEIGLHTFLTLEQATCFRDWQENYVIVKCIIPKGSRYYIGTFWLNYGKTAIAATALKYNKRPFKCAQ